MKNFYMVLFCTFCVFVITSTQADNLHAKKAKTRADISAKVNCDEASTQLEMNICAGEDFKLADEELNRLYKEKMAALETKDSKDRLRDMQRAWVVFRDKACFYEAGPREEGGSGWLLDDAICMEYHTKKRIEDLKKYLECTQNGCPN
jgi:uncharacterized protein YecT (DUF1311 family)